MGVENEIRRFCLFVAVRWKLRTGLCLTNIAIRIVHIHWIYVGLDEFNCTQLMDSWTIMYRLCDKYKSVLAQHLFAVAKTVDYVRIKHHPYFWRPERTLSFLLAAAQEVDCAIGSRDAARQCFLHRLECELSAAVIGDDWIAQIHPIIRSEISLPRGYFWYLTNIFNHFWFKSLTFFYTKLNLKKKLFNLVFKIFENSLLSC